MMTGSLTLFGAAGLLWGLVSHGALPDPHATPGAVDTHVTQANIQQSICVPGYARSARPPYATMRRLKADAMRREHPGERFSDFEFDHLVSLALGGAPLDRRNLWLEPRTGPWGTAAKDELEYALWVDVCHRGLPLAVARRAMATDWIGAYKRWVAGQTHAKWHNDD